MVWVLEVGLGLHLIGGGIQGETGAPGEVPGQMGCSASAPREGDVAATRTLG